VVKERFLEQVGGVGSLFIFGSSVSFVSLDVREVPGFFFSSANRVFFSAPFLCSSRVRTSARRTSSSASWTSRWT
jgi:hypothetical protein